MENDNYLSNKFPNTSIIKYSNNLHIIEHKEMNLYLSIEVADFLLSLIKSIIIDLLKISFIQLWVRIKLKQTIIYYEACFHHK